MRHPLRYLVLAAALLVAAGAAHVLAEAPTAGEQAKGTVIEVGLESEGRLVDPPANRAIVKRQDQDEDDDADDADGEDDDDKDDADGKSKADGMDDDDAGDKDNDDGADERDGGRDGDDDDKDDEDDDDDAVVN